MKIAHNNNPEIKNPSDYYKVMGEIRGCNSILGTTYLATLIDDESTKQPNDKNEYFSIYVTNEIFQRKENYLQWTKKTREMAINNSHPNIQRIIAYSINGQMFLPFNQDKIFDEISEVQQPMVVCQYFRNDDSIEQNTLNLFSKLYSTLDVNSPFNATIYITLHDLIDFEKSHYLFSSTNKQMIIYGIVSAMNYLHQNDICHHELTPSNIMIHLNSVQKVEYNPEQPQKSENDIKYCFQSDFIDVKVFNFESSIVNMSHLKNYPLIIESLPYYAPESLQNRIFDKMTDIYSFGIVLYQILTNDAHLYSELEDKETEIKIKVPAGYRPNIFISLPFQFQKIIDRCTDQDPEKRPSFQRLADLLVTERYILKGCDNEMYKEYFTRITNEESQLNIYPDENEDDESMSDDNEEEDTKEIEIEKEEEEEETKKNENMVPLSPSKYIKPKDLISSNNEKKIVGATLENSHINASNVDLNDMRIYQFNLDDLINNTKSVSEMLKNDEYKISDEDKLLLKKSLEGDSKSCYTIYTKLVKGEDGFPKKIDESVVFLKYAADHDDEKALFEYANILMKGEIIPHDYLTAFHYFKKSGELYGNDISLVKSGMLLESQGKLKSAKEYYKKAMDKGNLDASCHYAYLLEKESSSLSSSLSLLPHSKKDRKKKEEEDNNKYEQACKMYQEAAEKGSILGLYHYERVHQKNSDNYDPKLLIKYAKHIEEINPKKASLIYKKVADAGDPDAQVGYGLMLEKGLGISKPNQELAFFYYENSAKANNAAGNYNYARALQNGIGTRKNIQLACEYYEKAAKLGNADAMNSYGKLKEAGVVRRSKSLTNTTFSELNSESTYQPTKNPIKNDLDDAAQYFKMSADAGNAEGMVNYARFLELGCASTVPKNINESAKFYKMAADNGNADGMYNIARMLQGGIGITKDLKLAFTYFQKASETGNTRAMNSTGFMLHKGLGTAKNDQEALKYFKMGAKAGLPVSMNNYAEMLEKGEGNPEHRTNEAKALKYFKKAAEMNDPNAMYNYGRYLERGVHVTKNIEEAIEYYKKAALLRNPDGMYNYARMLEYVLHDKEKSVEFYERAANMRNTKAMIRYAEILESLNDPDDNEKILKFYKFAADSGDLESMKKIAFIYENGKENIPIDLTQSARYCKKAADFGSISSMHKYATMLRDGVGVVKNVNEAKLLFKKAADFGDSSSMRDYALIIEKEGKSDNIEICHYFYRAAKSGKKASSYYHYGRLLELLSNEFKKPVQVDSHLTFSSKEELMKEAAEMYKIAADKGNTDAMFSYAMCLSEGKGIEKNLIDSYKYFTNASRVGNINAITHAGIALKDGAGVTKDLEEARKLFKKGAEGGDPISMTNYALLLIEDNEIEEAKTYLYKAAELKEKSSYYPIAQLLERENYSNKDDILKYYKLSADVQMNQKGMKKYAELVSNEDEKIKYYELLYKCYHESNDSNDSTIINSNGFYEAMDNLGKIYIKNHSNDNALRCFKDSIKSNNIESYFNYAKLIDDKTEKYKYYKLCADYNITVNTNMNITTFNSNLSNNDTNAMIDDLHLDETSQTIKCEAAYEYAMYMKQKKVPSEFEKYIKIAADYGNLKAIIEYYKYLEKNSQLEESEKYVKIAADKGDIKSILNYANYSEATKNETECNKYYKMAAEQNSPKGLYKYGKIQEKNKKYDDAMSFYEKAADLKYTDAMIGIGSLNERGLGVDKDDEKAFDYYKNAAELGNAEAMWKCGQLIEEKSQQEAFNYYKMSANHHSFEGMLRYACCLRNGRGTPNNEKNEKLALHYYKELAHLGDVNSMRIAAMILMKSDKITDQKEAVQFLKAASDLGDADSQYTFGVILKKGIEKVVQKNERMAAKLLRKSAIGGNSDAMFEYSKLLFKGSNSTVMKNENEAIHYLKRSADRGNIKAILHYVEILRSSNKQEECQAYLRSLSIELEEEKQRQQTQKKSYIEDFCKLNDDDHLSIENAIVKVNSLIAEISEEMQNHAEAARMYKENADKNADVQSMLNYARMLLNGTGVEQNSREAAEYYKKAADLGSVTGMLEYAKLSQRGYGDQKEQGDALSYIERAASTTNLSGAGSAATVANEFVLNPDQSLEFQSMPLPTPPPPSSSSSPSLSNPLPRHHTHHHHLQYHARNKAKNVQANNNNNNSNNNNNNNKPMTLMSLGRALSSGFFDLGNPQELSEASQYFKKAADLGNSDAMYHYAKMCSKGIGIEQNYGEAFNYFLKSSEASREERAERKAMQNAQIQPSNSNFAAFSQVSDDCGIKATRKAAKMLLEGIGTPKDVKRAEMLFKEAAEEGQDLYSMYAYASILIKDASNREKDRKECVQKAAQYFKLAAQNGIVDAAVEYGKILESGYGGYEKNIDSAVDFYFIAAEAGNPEALYLIGHLYETGIGLDKSNKDAKNYYLKAANKGNVDAMMKIAHLYKKGKGGLQKSKQQAMLYYQKAADLGNVDAMLKYASMRKKQGDLATANLNDAKIYYEKAALKGSPKAKIKLLKLEKRMKVKEKKDGKPPPIPKKS